MRFSGSPSIPGKARRWSSVVGCSVLISNRRMSALFPYRESLLFTSSYPPLPPLRLQNLENKRFILPLPARSLSLKDLYAKSREHWGYGGVALPFWEKGGLPGTSFASHTWFGLPLGGPGLGGQIVKERLLSCR